MQTLRLTKWVHNLLRDIIHTMELQSDKYVLI